MKGWTIPSNSPAWAIGSERRGRFHVRRIVWGLLLAQTECREGEQVRKVALSVEADFKHRANIAPELPPLPVPDFSDKLGRD